MQVPFIDLKAQDPRILEEVKSAVNRIFDSQKFILSESVKTLETQVSKKIGTKYAIGVASGSDALYLALWALGVGPGDEVIAPPFTFFATAGAISRAGATPVFADIDPATFNLDPAQIEAKITQKTKAIIPVHLFGLCADMKAIMAIAKKHHLFVVEDVAQALGAKIGAEQAGSWGDAGCLSFFPTKNLGGAGDGGMVVTSSEALAEKIRVLRVHGSKQKYFHEFIGINSRLDELQAAVVLTKLGYLDDWNSKRWAAAKIYSKNLAGLPIDLPVIPTGYGHIFHLYSILTDKRDALQEHLEKNGIGTGVYYPLPLHLQPCYRDLGYRKGDFPVSERAAGRILSLPLYPEISKEALAFVISKIKSFF